MLTIKDILSEYQNKIDALDLELLISAALKKPREFVLAHPEYKLAKNQKLKARNFIARRLRHEPIAYILSQNEFSGLTFKVNRHTLIPRPETELLVEEVLKLNPKDTTIVDVGTGSGNIIISLAKNLKAKNKFIAVDISKKALSVAKQNAKTHRVGGKVKFIESNFLEKLIGNWKLSPPRRDPDSAGEIGNSRIIILANLPYLSKKIYYSVSKDIKKYEPRSALLSGKDGLAHYEKLFKQTKLLVTSYGLSHYNGTPPRRWRVTIFIEISPEQKNAINRLLRNIFPSSAAHFHKDLAGKWRVLEVKIWPS